MERETVAAYRARTIVKQEEKKAEEDKGEGIFEFKAVLEKEKKKLEIQVLNL